MIKLANWRLAAVVLLLASLVYAQGAGQSSQPQPAGENQSKPVAPEAQRSGAATAGPHARIEDAEHRTITAGGFVEGAPVVFTDATKGSGLDRFRHISGTPEKKYIIEVSGSGVALIDYDNDGWQDIYLVNSSTMDAFKGREAAPKAALFHNNHDGTFTDVTGKAGVSNDRWGFGVAVGDVDNDGWPDMFVSNFGKNRLYHNNHNGTFTDVAEKAGVTLGGWSSGVTMGDYDGDGRLDVFVAGYVQFDMDNPPAPGGSSALSAAFCQYRGQPVMCGPRGLRGEHDHLLHNNGDGTFSDVSEKAGVSDPNGYYGFSSLFSDVNNDGKLDLLVANDSTPNYLYINKGDGTFEDASYPSGFALNENGREQAGMGMAAADYKNDGKIDLYVTNFSDDYNVLYKDDGEGDFTDVSFSTGLGEDSIPFLGWGTSFLDYDNDGWKDLMVANGHVYREVDKMPEWGTTWEQRPLLFRNQEGKEFVQVPPAAGSGLAVVVAGRGMAVGDLFNDGRLDAVINTLDGAPVLLRNVVKNENHWVELKLIGGPKGPRDATGAVVYLTAGGVRQRCDVTSGGSFLSSSDQRLHFGLGKNTQVETVEVHWPGGAVEQVKLPGVNKIYFVQEGKGLVAGPSHKRSNQHHKPKTRRSGAKTGKSG